MPPHVATPNRSQRQQAEEEAPPFPSPGTRHPESGNALCRTGALTRRRGKSPVPIWKTGLWKLGTVLKPSAHLPGKKPQPPGRPLPEATKAQGLTCTHRSSRSSPPQRSARASSDIRQVDSSRTPPTDSPRMPWWIHRCCPPRIPSRRSIRPAAIWTPFASATFPTPSGGCSTNPRTP